VSEVTVRALRSGDVDDVVAIFGCPRVVAGTLQAPFFGPEDMRARLLQPSPDVRYLVAEVDGRVIGMLGLHVERNPRRRHAASFGMAVHDDFQNRGIGRALMAAMLDLADNWLGLQRIELQVFADNAAAVHLYERLGFRIEGTLHAFALRHGQYVDAYAMARLRPEPPANG
jgi:putative acetyltransferase